MAYHHLLAARISSGAPYGVQVEDRTRATVRIVPVDETLIESMLLKQMKVVHVQNHVPLRPDWLTAVISHHLITLVRL
jgi:hypothetical protein